MKHDWRQWIDRMKEPGATEEDARELEKALREDPSHSGAYIQALLEEVALESVDLPRPCIVPVRKRFQARSYLAWAAVIVAMGVASFFLGRGSSGGTDRVLGTITDADAPAEAAGIRIGSLLPQGDIVVPENSRIGIAMRSGARLQLQGPASLSIDSAERVILRTGRLKTYAPDYAHGFIVDTPEGRLVDLGTRFVTAAGGPIGTEVHVLEGLVRAEPGASEPSREIPGEEAAILKGGKLTPTDFLARRLEVPLDPNLPDQDGDGVPDVVEAQYGTDLQSAASMPKKLFWNETFEDSNAFRTTWSGAGEWLKEGLLYANGTALATSPGAYRTSGIDFAGCRHMIAAELLPADGVLYVSFLMRMPEYPQRDRPFAGLTFYQEDEETLFVGKVAPRASFGVRASPARSVFFGVRPDGETHLFVIRINRTRLVTDVFIDPVPGQLEATHQPSRRLHEAPVFDRVVMRSGSEGGPVQVDFDELRLGLTWESVLPVAR